MSQETESFIPLLQLPQKDLETESEVKVETKYLIDSLLIWETQELLSRTTEDEGSHKNV